MYIFGVIVTLIILLTLYGVFIDNTHKKSSYKKNVSPTTDAIPLDLPVSTTAIFKSSIETESKIIIPEPFIAPDISGRVCYHEYKVKGKNPLTNRMKTQTVTVSDYESDEEITKLSGLLDPITITLSPSSFLNIEPSEEQIKYATSLNIHIPSQCVFQDLSCLISKATGDDSPDLAPEALRSYAYKNKVYSSPYCGVQLLLCYLLNVLSVKDLASLWCYLVFCSINSIVIGDLSLSPYSDIFYSFYTTIADNPGLTNKISSLDYSCIKRYIIEKKIDNRYNATELYNFTKNYLYQNNILKL